MFHPTIDLLFQISTTSHPRVGASNPQKRVVSHCPLIAQTYHNPLIFSFNYLDFPLALFFSTFPTQGMHPFANINPFGVPFIRVSLAHVTENISARKLKGTHCQEKYYQTITNTCCFNATHIGVHS
jgi:hypothetical protein